MMTARALPGTSDSAHTIPELSADLRARAKVGNFPAEHVLFRLGDKPKWMYLVLGGSAATQRKVPSGAAVTLKAVRVGDVVAESSLTSPSYDCDGLCLTSCQLLQLPVAALRRAIDEDSGTRWWWINLLARQARQQRLRAERLALKSIHERLRHLVVTDSDAFGCVNWPGTRKALAMELGVTPEALLRAVADLEARGVVQIQRRGKICWTEP